MGMRRDAAAGHMRLCFVRRSSRSAGSAGVAMNGLRPCRGRLEGHARSPASDCRRLAVSEGRHEGHGRRDCRRRGAPGGPYGVAEVVSWLGHHGVTADAKAAMPSRANAPQLDAIARELKADVIVAGAYGYSRQGRGCWGALPASFLPARATGPPRRSMGHENGDRHARKQGPTGATKNHFPQSRVAVEAHDDEVYVMVRRAGEDELADVGIDRDLRGTVTSMPSGEPGGNVGARLGAMSYPLSVYHDQDDDLTAARCNCR